MAVKALPCGLKEFAIFFCIAGGEGNVTFKAFQAELEHYALAGIHLGHIGNALPFHFKISVEERSGKAVDNVVFVVDRPSFRAEAGTKLLVVAVKRRAETVVVAQGFSVCVFETEIGGQDFTADVAADIKDAETRSAPQRAFANISHGIGLGLP